MTTHFAPKRDAGRIRIAGAGIVVVAAAFAAPAASDRPEAGRGSSSGETYEIRRGDTLWGIARARGCSVDALREANGITGDRIVAGTTIRIPDACGTPHTAPSRSSSRDRGSDPAGSAAPTAAPPPSVVGDSRVTLRSDVDTAVLPAAMSERGFAPPQAGFMAYLIEIAFEANRAGIAGERRWDWNGTSDEAEGWNPASTVKLYAAVAALLHARDLGAEPTATLTFHSSTGDHVFSLRELVQAAVGPSDNVAYDYLAVFAGFDRVHEGLFSADRVFAGTALRVPYARKLWERLGYEPFLRRSPPITVETDSRTVVLPARNGRASVECDQASCTTLIALGEMMRRVMLQEMLPPDESLDLHPDDLELLRGLLATERSRGEEVVRGLRPFFGENAVLYHKAGYAGDWYTDNVYVDDPALDRAWIVVLSGSPGRSCLDAAARIIGDILSTGALDP